jgi:pyruvate/2-oxoglutarate dehydrogenase complex dihydrolipoamide acyltransferase (E2) component
LRLAAEGEKTVLNYNGEAQLSGRIASVGQRLVDSTARSITRQGLESLDRQIQARLHPQPEPEPASPEQPASPSPAQAKPKPQPAATPPSQMEVGITVAKDVASDLVRDLAEERSFKGRDVAVLISAALAILWMWNWLFGKD